MLHHTLRICVTCYSETDDITFGITVDSRIKVPGVSEKSDEFITCIFRVVLGIERRMGYQVKACSKIFCLSGNPPLGVTVLGSAGTFS